MKKIITSLLILVSLIECAQNNSLNPNSKWSCWDLDGATQCKDTYKYNLYFNGDSIINGNQYLKMYKVGYEYNSLYSSFCNVPNSNYNYFEKLVRYHQNKLLYYNGSADVTYIDYNLNIGDSIKNVAFTSTPLKITRMDSVNVNGNYLKRFFYKCTTSLDTGYVIEKIGSYHGFLSEFTPFFESYKELLCYAENNLTVYTNIGATHSSCDITLNLNSTDLQSEFLEIYPNPVSDKLTISSLTTNEIKKIVIKDYLGQTAIQFKKPSINPNFDISLLANGIYFVEIETGNSKITKKIIKQ